MENDIVTILNYPGSKKRLLGFINSAINDLLPSGGKILDVFSGTSSVAYSLKRDYCVAGNDAEIYCYEIAKALLVNNKILDFSAISETLKNYIDFNLRILEASFCEVKTEKKLIEEKETDKLVEFYHSFLNVWQEGYFAKACDSKYKLFSTYYSNSYFGLYQAMEIDSIRYAIEQYKNTDYFDALLACLFFAMKEAVFSKDGHMAQPLNVSDKRSILIKRRSVSISKHFFEKMNDFSSKSFVTNNFENYAFNLTLDDFLSTDLINNFDLIYADPPYTDMQYSRYFHLLETVTKYDYPQISSYRGKVSTGLYRENRFQSPLSQRGKAKKDLEILIRKCAELNKTIVFSYAHPVDLENQKSDRYTMSMEDLKSLFIKHYGEKNTIVLSENFQHCNNRNAEVKKVFEYLVIGRAKK